MSRSIGRRRGPRSRIDGRSNPREEPPRLLYHDGRKEGPRHMSSLAKYAVIDPAIGKLDRRIFSDQAVYDDEMEKIFGRAWLMIGHESLVPGLDDFFHTYMGED